MRASAVISLLALSCASHVAAPTRIEEPRIEQAYQSRMDDISFLHETYFDPESFEPTLEQKLGFEMMDGNLVRLLGKGTGHEVPAYLLKGRQSGPVGMVLAPHGDEIGAWKAALALTQYEVISGSLVVVPWLDSIAVKAKARYNYVFGADPNREYGDGGSGTYVSRIAHDVKQLIESKEISVVLNLHEAFGYHSLNPNNLGQSIIVDSDGMLEKAQGFLAMMNQGLKGKMRFEAINLPNPLTLTYFCMTRGVDAYGMETSKNLDDDVSMMLHLANSRLMLEHYGIRIVPR